MSFARRVLVACLMAASVSAAQADEAKAPPAPKATPSAPPAKAAPARPAATPDDELLEFLGSVDSEEGDEAWLDYLSQADIAKAARKKASAADPEGDKK